MITRSDILGEAVHRCIRDMYLWSQPSIDIDELIKNGFKDDEKNPLYNRHYLSTKNFIYIRDVYIRAYNMNDGWFKTFETLIDYLYKGGLKDKYVVDNNGLGHREYEDVPSLYAYLDKEDADIAMSLIGECMNFYRVDKEKNDFSCTVSIGVGSPSCNKEGVEKYWQSNGRLNFVIKDFFIEDILYGTEENDYEPIMTKEEFINTLK